MISDSISTISPEAEGPEDSLVHGVRIGMSSQLQQDESKSSARIWNSRPKEPPLFWLDTLCIPVAAPDDSQDVKSDVDKLKLIAINQMGQIYAAASRVLVLDSELQQSRIDSSDAVSHVEILARLVCSAWMRRCWTLQEGALATKIIFLSASGLITALLPLTSGEDMTTRLNLRPGPLLYVWAFKYVRSLLRWRDKYWEAQEAAIARPILEHLRYRFQEVLTNVTEMRNKNNLFGHATATSQLEVFWFNLESSIVSKYNKKRRFAGYFC